MNDNQMTDDWMTDISDAQMIKNIIHIGNLYEKMQYHIDFIIGRGKNNPHGYRNIPIDPCLMKRNVIFIDPNPAMDSDIKEWLHKIDFSQFGICITDDPEQIINVRFIFDWSSFYCSAVSNMANVIRTIKHRCQILVPLDQNENTMPHIIKVTYNDPIFKPEIIEGLYPLFDWNRDDKQTINVINPSRYIRINAYT